MYKVKVRDIFLSRALEALPGKGTAAEGGWVVLIREDGSGSHDPHSDAHHQHALRAEGRHKVSPQIILNSEKRFRCRIMESEGL